MINISPIIYIDGDEDDHIIMGSLFKSISPNRPVMYFTKAEDFLTYLRATQQPPFIILCDLLLPGMTGMELRKTIQDDDQLSNYHVPFIFLTSSISPIVQLTIEKAFGSAVQGFFEKVGNRQQQQREMKLIFDYWQTSYRP